MPKKKDDEWCPQESAKASRASEEFLEKKKKKLRLRGKRKRGGQKRNKSKGSMKNKRSTKKVKKSRKRRFAAEPAFRGSSASRKKRSRKKIRKTSWSLSRKMRNRKAHAIGATVFNSYCNARLYKCVYLWFPAVALIHSTVV